MLDPAFCVAEIFDELTDSAGGARTRALSSFVYSVFTGGLAGASMPTPGKPVLFARGRLTFGTRAPYLALGAAGDERLLIPFPKVDEQLLARPVHGTVGLSRDAVHTAAEDIVERVNIGWPAALALAAIDTAH